MSSRQRSRLTSQGVVNWRLDCWSEELRVALKQISSLTSSPSSALVPTVFGEGSPTKIDYRKRVPLFEPLYWKT